MRDDIIAIVCPDIHGRTFWEEVSNVYDGSVPFIFLGDYLDPYPDEGITNEDAVNNLKKLWEFKNKWGDNVIFLLGNHDLSYYNSKFRCSRYSGEVSEWYKNFLNKNWEHFKIAFGFDYKDVYYLFTHAGVNKNWIKRHNFEEILNADYINSLFSANENAFNDYGFYRGGYNTTGSPVWSDIREYVNQTDKDSFNDNTFQIVGHTQLIKDKVEFKNICCIDSRQVFVITKDMVIEEYNKKED